MSRIRLPAARISLVLAVGSLLGCATTESVVGATRIPSDETDSRTTLHPVDVLKLTVDEPLRQVRGDVTASLRVVPARSQMTPPIGSEPGASSFAVIELSMISHASRVRELDVLVGFPVAAGASGSDAQGELPEMTRVRPAPGTAYVISGASRSPVRLYPDIETSVFLRLSAPAAGTTVDGFVGVFDAQAGDGGAGASAIRFPLHVANETRTGRYRQEMVTHGTVKQATLETDGPCLNFFGLMGPPARRQEEVPDSFVLDSTEPRGKETLVSTEAPAPTGESTDGSTPDDSSAERPRHRLPTGAGETPSAGAATSEAAHAADANSPCAHLRPGGQPAAAVRVVAGKSCRVRGPDGEVRQTHAREIFELEALPKAGDLATVSGVAGKVGRIRCDCLEAM